MIRSIIYSVAASLLVTNLCVPQMSHANSAGLALLPSSMAEATSRMTLSESKSSQTANQGENQTEDLTNTPASAAGTTVKSGSKKKTDPALQHRTMTRIATHAESLQSCAKMLPGAADVQSPSSGATTLEAIPASEEFVMDDVLSYAPEIHNAHFGDFLLAASAAGTNPESSGPGICPRNPLDLNESQFDQLVSLKDHFMVDSASQIAEMVLLRHKLRAVLFGSTINSAEVTSIHDKMSRLRNELSDRKLRFSLDAATVLTPEQRSKLKQRHGMHAHPPFAHRVIMKRLSSHGAQGAAVSMPAFPPMFGHSLCHPRFPAPGGGALIPELMMPGL